MRELARATKGGFRKQQAGKMGKQYDKSVEDRKGKIGTNVGVIPDKRDMPRARNIPGVVFAVGRGGGCQVVTKHGILVVHGSKSSPHLSQLTSTSCYLIC